MTLARMRYSMRNELFVKQTSIDDALYDLENYLEKWFEENT
jgi:hypothetical protein